MDLAEEEKEEAKDEDEDDELQEVDENNQIEAQREQLRSLIQAVQSM